MPLKKRTFPDIVPKFSNTLALQAIWYRLKLGHDILVGYPSSYLYLEKFYFSLQLLASFEIYSFML